jgi:hypothetical protein
MEKVRMWSVPALLLLSTFLGCEGIIGLLLGESPLRRLPLEVSVRDGTVSFSAERSFAGIGCGTYDLDRAARHAPDVVRTVWSARCPEGDDCVRSVAYGSHELQVEVAAEPLVPGQCYICNIGGGNGRGDVIFEIRADGTIGPCQKRDVPK